MAAAQPAPVMESSSSFDDKVSKFETNLRAVRARGEQLSEFGDEMENMLKTLKKYEDTRLRLLTKQKNVEGVIASKRDKAAATETAIADVKKKQDKFKEDIARFNDERAKVSQHVNKANADIAAVNEDVSQLQKLLDVGPGLTRDQETELKVLSDKKEQLQLECDAYTGQLVNLRMGTKQQMDVLVSEQEAKTTIEAAIAELKKKNNDIKLETKKAQRRKDKLDAQLQALNKQREDVRARVQAESDANVAGTEEVAEKQRKYDLVSGSVAQYVKTNDDLLSRVNRLRKEVETREEINKGLAKQNAEFEKALHARAKETDVIDKDTSKMGKLQVVASTKTAQFEARRTEAEDEKAALQAQIRELQAAIEEESKQTTSVVRSHATYERQREIMNKNLRNEGDATQATNDLVVVTQNEIKNLENELRAFRDEAVDQRRAIEAAAEEREKYEVEATQKNQNYYAVIEDVKLADMEIVEVQKQIIEVETKLKSQQNMYEAVRSDRNLYSKNLLEAQEQVVVMKRKFNILTSLIQQLKLEIVSKDHALVKEHFAHHRVENEIQMLRNDLTRIRKQIQSSEQIINNQVNEIRKLLTIINDAEAEKERQKKEHAAVIAERDTLGANLVKRNNEVNELYEKIKVRACPSVDVPSPFRRVGRECVCESVCLCVEGMGKEGYVAVPGVHVLCPTGE
jgi:chromosome segregation ATPase